MDLPDIYIVVQWRATCTVSTLWQRFGRAGRDRALDTTAILLAEKEFFDEEKEKKGARQQARLARQKRKASTNVVASPNKDNQVRPQFM